MEEQTKTVVLVSAFFLPVILSSVDKGMKSVSDRYSYFTGPLTSQVWDDSPLQIRTRWCHSPSTPTSKIPVKLFSFMQYSKHQGQGPFQSYF